MPRGVASATSEQAALQPFSESSVQLFEIQRKEAGQSASVSQW